MVGELVGKWFTAPNAAAQPDGRVLIWDQFADEDHAFPEFMMDTGTSGFPMKLLPVYKLIS